MKELLYGFVYSTNEVFNIGCAVISIVSGIYAIVAEMRTYKKLEMGNGYLNLLLLLHCL